MSEQTGKLFVVSTPIGNKDDITARAVNVLTKCDLVVCEEVKEGAITLRNINLKKELTELNEQNEIERVPEIIELLNSGQKIALISDAGTPVFADPGFELVKAALKSNIDIEVVPGVTSIMTALVRSGFTTDEFLYAGFLDRKEGERLNKLQQLSKENRTVVILETPYRLNAIISSAAKIMPNRNAYLGLNLTMPFETHHYGTFAELNEKFENEKIKAEFVIVFEGSGIVAKQYNSDSDGFSERRIERSGERRGERRNERGGKYEGKFNPDRNFSSDRDSSGRSDRYSPNRDRNDEFPKKEFTEGSERSSEEVRPKRFIARDKNRYDDRGSKLRYKDEWRANPNINTDTPVEGAGENAETPEGQDSPREFDRSSRPSYSRDAGRPRSGGSSDRRGGSAGYGGGDRSSRPSYSRDGDRPRNGGSSDRREGGGYGGGGERSSRPSYSRDGERPRSSGSSDRREGGGGYGGGGERSSRPPYSRDGERPRSGGSSDRREGGGYGGGRSSSYSKDGGRPRSGGSSDRREGGGGYSGGGGRSSSYSKDGGRPRSGGSSDRREGGGGYGGGKPSFSKSYSADKTARYDSKSSRSDSRSGGKRDFNKNSSNKGKGRFK